MKVNRKQFIESATFSAGVTVGVMGSCVVADKSTTTLKSGVVRHGLLRIVGVAVAAFVSSKDNATKFAQGVGIGIAATQLTAALKAVVIEDGKKTMEEGIMEIAFGSPGTEVAYVDSTLSLNYYPYEEVSTITATQPMAFLSAPSQFVEV